MADDTATATAAPPQQDSTTSRTFQIPVETAAPQDHIHQGKRFKIPVETKQFSIPVEEPAADTSHVHTDYSMEAYNPPWYQRVANVFHRFHNGRYEWPSDTPDIHGLTSEQILKLHDQQEKDQQDFVGQQSDKFWTAPNTAGVAQMKSWLDTSGASGDTGVIDLSSLMTSEQRRRDPDAKSVLDIASNFTSPNSAKQQLEWTIGGTLLGPVMGVGLGTAGAGAEKIGLQKLGGILASPKTVAWAMRGTMYGPVLKSLAQESINAAEHSDPTDPQYQEGAWGAMLGNLVVLAALHYGTKGLDLGNEGRQTEILNERAQKTYSQRFKTLDPLQKADVLYQSAQDVDPAFRERVTKEVERINKARGKVTSKTTQTASGETTTQIKKPTVAGDRELSRNATIQEAAKNGIRPVILPSQVTEEAQVRIQAAKNVINGFIASRAQETAFRVQAAAQEAEVRRQAYLREKAADQPPAGTSIEQERGFPVEESRVTALLPNRGSVMTTEREGQMFNPEPEKPEATPKVEDRRFWIGDRDLTPARAHEAEAPIQQFAEQRTGVSFSQLPVARQRVMARYFERFQPEQWEAFKKTPAYAEFMGRAQATAAADATLKPYLERNPIGENVSLAPDADLHAGLAKLILARTDIDAALKADPATYRDLNEHAEKSMGYSFDALKPEDRPAALAEYLRDKPEKVGAFLTPDLTERIQSGQHIDLANMAATLADRQQVQVLMSHRDAVRREMDADAMQQMVLEERGKHDAEIATVLRAAPTGETRSFETVDDAARGLTAMAEKLNLGRVSSVDDVFKVEQEARKLPKGLRTPEINQFLTRMRIARVAAEDHILRQMAEESASKMRSDPDSARESAAREIVNLSSQAADLNRTADHLPAEEAEPVRETAAFLDGKANAIVAGAEAANNPPPERPLVRPEIPLSVGRATRVVYPAKPDGLPAHYAIVDAGALQTSHMPLSYEERPGYDQNGQPRKYDINRTAQEFIESRAGNLDLDILLSNDPQTVGGPPVADQRMHVISGNGRSLYLLTALERSPAEFQRYLRELHERAAGFGLDPADLTKYKNPVLVKILDEPITSAVEWARMGREMNVDPALGMSSEEMGVALARLLTPENTERLAGIIDSLPTVDEDGKALTVREAMRARSKEIATLMTDTGIISAHKSEEFLENGELKGKAKDLFESMLAGLTVSDPAILKDASASTRDKLARAGLYFVQARGAGDIWNLASYNTDAVDLLNRAQTAEARLSDMVGRDRAARQKKEGKRDDISRATGRDDSIVEKFLHPERYLDAMNSFAFDDQALHPPAPAAVEALAMALEESPKAYASLIATYAYDAKNGGQTLYGAEHPATAFTNNIASRYGLKVDPDEWGMVHGLPESVKAGLEAGRDPLPVEPAVHAETVIQDATPDASSVTDVLKGGPRTVADLRTALAGHPNLSVAEADGLATVFEAVLPRAIGESFEDLLGNRRLNLAIGGTDGKSRGYHEIVEDGKAIIRLCDSGDSSTFLHEMAHYIRQYLKPEDQAVANGFVGAKPGEDWTDAQEEKFAQAFERYHYDGGIRRGKLEAVFATLHRAMQSIYNAMTSLKLAKGTPELNAMFDRWYDWQRSERKPVTARLDVDALEDAAKGKVTIPDGARKVDGRGVVSDGAQNFVFLGKDDALKFVQDKKNGVRSWELFQKKGDDAVYIRADLKKGRRLHQAGLNDAITLARQARDLEAQLKKTTDPREQARLRGALNGIEDKLRGSTFVIGGKSDPPDTSATQLIYGVGEKPTVNEPTTPAQAVTAQQKMGDPTGVSLGGEREPRKVSDEPARNGEAGADRVPEREAQPNREHGTGKPAPIAKPDKHPLAEVKAAKLKSPDRPRGTPVVDPDVWRGHVEALGLPEGTPPPTIRVSPDVRQMMIYPGQAEAIEGALSALQQYDATILAAPTGSGKTAMLSTIANHLLGDGGDRIGLIVTRSQNLIHEADGYIEWGRKVGLTVEGLPSKMNELQTGGAYAATYAQIRGAKDVFSIPWDFVLFDESAEARNWTDSEQGKAVVLLGHAAKKVVYASATPYHCLAPDTLVLMHDGSVKRVQDVVVGDDVMGPDSKPRKVCGLSHGHGQMYNVIPRKGDPYKVNENHVLSLRMAGRTPSFQKAYGKRYMGWRSYPPDAVVNLSVTEYLRSSKTFRERLLGYRTGVDFPEREVTVDPYWLGLWLGDGDALTAEVCVASIDPEIEQYIRQYAQKLGLVATEDKCAAPTVKVLRISRGRRGSEKGKFGAVPLNPLVAALKSLQVIGRNSVNKHIPNAYKANSRSVRLQLLAGIIDSDGTCSQKGFSVTTKSKRLADDIVFLCRSLGFAAYAKPIFYKLSKHPEIPNWQIGISGDMEVVPTLLPRKKCPKRKVLDISTDKVSLSSRNAKDVLKVGIRVEPCGIGEFYGFEVDGDKLFVLGDFTVTHNSVMELGYMHKLGMWPHGGFTQWAEQFGLREVAPNTFAGGTSAAKLEKLRQQLVERGQWQTLYKDMDGVEAHVAMVPQTDEVKEGVRNIRAAFAMAAKAFEKAGMSWYLTPTAGHEAIYLKRYIAGSKLQSAIELGKKLSADGWAPLFFSEYRSPADEGMDFFHNLPGDLGKRINKMLPPLPDIVGEMRKAFGEKIGIFAGDANQIRAGELEGFMSGEKDALYMTYSAGAVGTNAQDKVGDRPRAAVFIDLPWSGIMFEQGTGRPWRYGTKSNVAMFMLTSDALPEMKVLATKILPRMRSLRAAVYGEKVESSLSKSLRESVGIPEEMLQYEQGQEYKPQAAEFEQQGEGASYTHIDDLELPSAKKAMNKGMKYKGKGRLYQGPRERTNIPIRADLPGAEELRTRRGKIRAEKVWLEEETERTNEQINDLRKKAWDFKAPREEQEKAHKDQAQAYAWMHELINRKWELLKEEGEVKNSTLDVGQLRVDKSGQPVVYMNNEAMQMLRTAINPWGFFSELQGLNIHADEIPRVKERLKQATKRDYTKRREPLLPHVTQLLDEAAARAGEGGITIIGSLGHGIQGTIDTAREELLHRWQRIRSIDGMVGQHLDKDAFDRLYAQIPKSASVYLKENGYKESPEEYVIETSAKLMAGKAKRMGVTADEAEEFLGKYFAEVEKRHGANAIRELEHTRGVASRLRDEFIRREDERDSQQPASREPERQPELKRERENRFARFMGSVLSGLEKRHTEEADFRHQPRFSQEINRDEDPFHKAANDAWGELLERVKNQPAGVAGVFHANESLMRMEAADAGRKAMGTGEPVEGAIKRRMRDMENDTLIWLDDLKDSGRAGVHFAKSSVWMLGTSGDRAIEKVFREAGMPKEGAEMRRRIVDYDIRSGNYRGELGGMVAKIIHENKLTPPEHELVTKVVENQATSDDPRINRAADEYRKFFAFVRRRLADAGAAVTIYGKDGKAEHIPYTKIADDPNYWPRLYDWNKKIILVDPKTGEKTITTLGKVRDMPTSDERREKLIDRIAEQRGISKMMAQAFLENRQRGIRLAGNVERAREFDIPMYGRDRRAIERYVNEVSETIAASEVHGQNREKTDALLNTLPYGRDRELANHIVTADLDPARLGDEDRVALRWANRALVLSKMTLSFMKVGFHQVKTSMATNTRSVARALVETAVHPRDVYQNAADCGALVNYMRTAWMREYGMRTGGIDQRMLDVTLFTPLMYFTRMTSAAAGRLWLEKYVYPELAKDPKNPILRRKLTDLYGYTDEQIDHLAANGYGPADVKRVSLAAANWTTGSGRPSELPPALRGYSGDPLLQRLTTLMRIAQSLHGFMFKTANLVNRTVWQELYHEDPKSFAPYHLIGRFAVNFGLAGLVLNELLYLRHKVSGSNEANIEERRREWLLQHPASKESLFYAMSDISMGMGLEPLTQLTQDLATADPKDHEKLAQQHRTLNAAGELVWGVAGDSIWDSAKATNDYAETFHDTGKHRSTPEERRAKILEQLANEEVPASRFVLKPHPAPAPVHHARRRRASTVLR